MAVIFKVEGTGGGSSGTGITSLEFYDEVGSLIKLTFSNILETNAVFRSDVNGYLNMFQTRGGVSPYTSDPTKIYYVIKIPDEIIKLSKVYVKNWGASYSFANLKISKSINNGVNYEEIYNGNFNAEETKEILQNYEIVKKRYIIKNGLEYVSVENKNKDEVLNMTSNNTPSPYVAKSSSEYSLSYQAWKAFNTLSTASDCWISKDGLKEGWLEISYGERKIMNYVDIRSRNDSSALSASPKDFKILGSNDGVDFDTLGTFSVDNWAANQTKRFEFNNNKFYKYYRINVSKIIGAGSYITIGMIQYGLKSIEYIEFQKLNDENIINYGISKFSETDLSLLITSEKYIVSPNSSREVIKTPLDKSIKSIIFK